MSHANITLHGRELSQLLQSWLDAGVLRPLDRALALVLLRCIQTHHGMHAVDADAAVLAAMLSRHLADGHTCLNLADLATELDAYRHLSDAMVKPTLLPQTWWAERTPEQWVKHLSASQLVSTNPEQKTAPLVLDGQRLYLYRLWLAESRIAESLRQRLGLSFELDQELITGLRAMFSGDQPVPQPGVNWQMLACALAAGGAITLITGGPGTGKTTTVVRLLALLQQQALDTAWRQGQTKPLRMALAAPTGKAAARLTESIAGQLSHLPLDARTRPHIPTQVSTLHRLLGSRPHTRHFRYHASHPLALDVLVVDEASMIDLELMDALLQALPHHARLILLGDKDQLASVEAGAILGELCDQAQYGWYTQETLHQFERVSGLALNDHDLGLRRGQPDKHALAQRTVMLRHSRRFDDDSGIGQLAAAVNAMDTSRVRRIFEAGFEDVQPFSVASPGDPALQQLVRQGYHGFQVQLQQPPPTETMDDDSWQAWARRLLEALDTFRVLCAVRDGPWGVHALNLQIEQWLGVPKSHSVEHNDQTWYSGRPVMMTRNDYALGLMNGDIGVTIELPQASSGPRFRVAFPHGDDPDRVRFVLPSRLTSVETVYAMTVHKSQGSEFDHVALVLPAVMAPVLTKELLYTAMTRARQQLSLVYPVADVWWGALRRRVRRYSGLRDRIMLA